MSNFAALGPAPLARSCACLEFSPLAMGLARFEPIFAISVLDPIHLAASLLVHSFQRLGLFMPAVDSATSDPTSPLQQMACPEFSLSSPHMARRWAESLVDASSEVQICRFRCLTLCTRSPSYRLRALNTLVRRC